jgi:hypothetical protein
MEGLKASKNQDADLKAALEALQKAEDSGFLFGTEQDPPPYDGGTGKQGLGRNTDGVSAAFAELNPGIKIN